MSTGITDDAEFPNQLSSVDKDNQQQRHQNNLWRSNYHEASIYIEEGLNNDKFENHPRKRATLAANTQNNNNRSILPSLTNNNNNHHHHENSIIANQTSPLISCDPQKPFDQQQSSTSSSSYSKQLSGSKAQSLGNNYLLGGQFTTIETYILVHNKYFYQLDLIASIALLLLALFEPPAIEGYELAPNSHAGIEMFALGIIAIELLLKFRWMGPRRFFHHGRTVIKLIVLLTMNVEAIVIFLRHSTHARYSRALRPIFLFDNHYCHGMRRAIRQIFQSLPPILDMFTLAMFFMFVFSIFGFYLFASNNLYFSDMPATVGNLLILATTANLPDIMMPSYAKTRWSTIFFVLFIIIHLFLLTNLTMAAVYESFTRKEKEKFHKLLLHRRKACQEAFKLLVSRRQPNQIQYRQFMGLMRYLNRKCSMFDAYLIFKALDTDQSGSISLEEFYQVYDFINLKWKLIYPEIYWYDECEYVPNCFKYSISIVRRVLNHRYFEWTIDLLIGTAAALQFIEAAAFEFDAPTNQLQNQGDLRPDSISTSIFICIFVIESVFRCLASGWMEYWENRWNRFDVLVLLLSISGLITGYFGGPPFGWVIVLRVLRLMRLFEFKRRYRDMWQTLTYILLKRFVSMTCVVMILYYFFAIIGMELLSEYDLRNCCKNTSLESQFKFDNKNDSAHYYLNDFGDIVASYLTLFSMSSNTYWLATMSAYSIVAQTNWLRLFFGFYYLCSIIVMNIVIAFILESFLFRMHYRSKMGNNCDDTNLFTVRVTLSSNEVDFLRKNLNHYFDKNLDKIITRKYGADAANKSAYEDADEKIALISKEPKQLITPEYKKDVLNKLRDHEPVVESQSSAANKGGPVKTPASASKKGKETNNNPVNHQLNNRWYLIYQAEQIRNKFSFTMKMYSDEVEGWLAEAERADQDELSLMISRNQIRAEHVAMARLARRSIAASGEIYLTGPRGRSWSSSSGLVGVDARVAEAHKNGKDREKRSGKERDKGSKH